MGLHYEWMKLTGRTYPSMDIHVDGACSCRRQSLWRHMCPNNAGRVLSATAARRLCAMQDEPKTMFSTALRLRAHVVLFLCMLGR